MNVIWKAELKTIDVQEIEVPVGAEMLCVHEQLNRACIWYRGDPLAEKEKRLIGLVATGKPVPERDDSRYLGTVFLLGGNLVFHVFEKLARIEML